MNSFDPSPPAVIEDPSDGVFVCRFSQCGQPHDGSYGGKTRGMYCDVVCQRLGTAERRRLSWKRNNECRAAAAATGGLPATAHPAGPPAAAAAAAAHSVASIHHGAYGGVSVHIRVHDELNRQGGVAKRQITAEFDSGGDPAGSRDAQWLQHLQSVVASSLAQPLA